MLLDLELDRARPGASFGSGRGVDVVQQTAIARGLRLVARGPFARTPLELQLQVVVLEDARRAELPEDFT